MVLNTKRRRATIAIKRLGESCVITVPSGNVGTDGYGKTTEDSEFTSLASERVVKVYGGGGIDSSIQRHQGGRLPANSPLLILRHDSEIQPGFRVTYSGETFEIDSLSRYPTHVEADTTLVT